MAVLRLDRRHTGLRVAFAIRRGRIPAIGEVLKGEGVLLRRHTARRLRLRYLLWPALGDGLHDQKGYTNEDTVISIPIEPGTA